MTISEAIRSASGKLSAAGIATGRLDAEVLLAHLLNRDRAWLVAHDRDVLDHGDCRLFEDVLARRAKREPLQYIIGMQEFWGLEFDVAPDVLIPRPETEFIIESALAHAGDRNAPLRILDLCTGSGCLAVTLARELPYARIMATDLSTRALAIAQKNARRHGVADRIRFLEGDLFVPVEELNIAGQVDMIVSNPPYVPSGDLPKLQPEVRDFEPEIALDAGPEGTEIHQRIINGAPALLKKQGSLIMEMGIGQAEALAAMVRETGAFGQPEILKDLAGIERVIAARKK